MILRIFKSRASLLSKSAKELFDAEFYDVRTPEDQGHISEFDDGVSTYEIEAGIEARTTVEHRAAAMADPPRKVAIVDLADLKYPMKADDPNGPFSHINSAHRLLDVSPTETGLGQFAELVFELLSANGATQDLPAEKMRDYVQTCVKSGDREWLSFLESSTSKWHKFAAYTAPNKS